MPWHFYFHAAVDVFIMLGILYILLCLFEVRRKIYPRDFLNHKDDDAHEHDTQDNERESLAKKA